MAPSRRQFIPFNMPYAQNPQELIDAVTAALRASPIPDVARTRCPVLHHSRNDARPHTLRGGGMDAPARLKALAVSAVLNRIYFALQARRHPGNPRSAISSK